MNAPTSTGVMAGGSRSIVELLIAWMPPPMITAVGVDSRDMGVPETVMTLDAVFSVNVCPANVKIPSRTGEGSRGIVEMPSTIYEFDPGRYRYFTARCECLRAKDESRS